jgi:hypothetical protein
MKRHLLIIVFAFIVSCNKKDNLLSQDNLIEKQEEIKFVDSISGIYKTEFDSISNCPITLKISSHKGNYFYNLVTSKRNLKGKIYFINDGSFLVLEGIPWNEFEGDIIKEPDAEKLSVAENGKDIPKGIPFLIFKDKLKLQNFENSMNNYIPLGECGTKNVQLMKQ